MRTVCAMPTQIWHERSVSRALKRQRQGMHIDTTARRSVQQYGHLLVGRSVLAVGQERSVTRLVTEQLRQVLGVNIRERLRNGGGDRPGRCRGERNKWPNDSAGN